MELHGSLAARQWDYSTTNRSSPWSCSQCCFKSQPCLCYISQTKAAKFRDGSIREIQGAKSRRAASQNHAFGRGHRNTIAKRTAGREASRRGRAARHQKIGASTFKAPTARRDKRAGLKFVYSLEYLAGFHFPILRR